MFDCSNAQIYYFCGPDNLPAYEELVNLISEVLREKKFLGVPYFIDLRDTDQNSSFEAPHD